ncbi:MAG: LysM peptidoglycan-binding domain-containing protein [Acidimicrobiales bacterium]
MRVAWVGLLLGVALGFAGVGGRLGPPSVIDPGSWGQWAGSRTPVEGAFAVLGLVAVVLAWYLLAVTALLAAGRLWGSARLVSLADVLTLPMARCLIDAGIGLSLAGTTIVGGSGGAPAVGVDGRLASRLPPVVLVSAATADHGGVGSDVLAADDVPAADEGDPQVDQVDPANPPPVMRRLPDGPLPSAGAPSVPLPGTEVAAPTAADEGVTQWEVRPGDHLWAVAARTLTTAWGTEPTDHEVVPYWRSLVAANRDHLADPANPDLVFPGQVVVVPAPPPSPR